MAVGRRAFLRLASGGSVVSLVSVCSAAEVNAAGLLDGGRAAAQSDATDLNLPAGAFSENLQVVGYGDLDGRPGFKLNIQQVADRWYLYMGHL